MLCGSIRWPQVGKAAQGDTLGPAITLAMPPAANLAADRPSAGVRHPQAASALAAAVVAASAGAPPPPLLLPTAATPPPPPPAAPRQRLPLADAVREAQDQLQQVPEDRNQHHVVVNLASEAPISDDAIAAAAVGDGAAASASASAAQQQPVDGGGAADGTAAAPPHHCASQGALTAAEGGGGGGWAAAREAPAPAPAPPPPRRAASQGVQAAGKGGGGGGGGGGQVDPLRKVKALAGKLAPAGNVNKVVVHGILGKGTWGNVYKGASRFWRVCVLSFTSGRAISGKQMVPHWRCGWEQGRRGRLRRRRTRGCGARCRAAHPLHTRR